MSLVDPHQLSFDSLGPRDPDLLISIESIFPFGILDGISKNGKIWVPKVSILRPGIAGTPSQPRYHSRQMPVPPIKFKHCGNDSSLY